MSSETYSETEKISRKSAMKALVIASIAFALILVNVGIALAQFGDSARDRALGNKIRCKSNLKDIGTALDMHYVDFRSYPQSLSVLVSTGYLGAIPKCPSAGADTYSASYTHNQNHYKIYCKGNAHKTLGVPPNMPSFDSEMGLRDE